MVTQCSPTRVAPARCASSGCEMRKSTGSWCRYLKMGVDNREKKGSVAITCPPDFNLLAARFRNSRGFFRWCNTFVSVMTSMLLSLIASSLSIWWQSNDKVEIIEIKDVACYDV